MFPKCIRASSSKQPELDFHKIDVILQIMVTIKHSTGTFCIGLILIDGFALMSYSSIVEPLRAANLLSRRAYYDIKYIPVTGSCANSSNGTSVKATGRIGQEGTFDLVLVVAGGDPASFKDTKLFRWLRTLSRRGVDLGGVSGGPVILASAGVMEGRRMTVHWEHAAALAESRVGLLIERSLYVIDRDRFTCAGGIAPLDMMHALLSEHHGPAFARRVSDWFMHTDVRSASGPQRAGLVERYGTNNPPVIMAIEAMENHISDPLELTQLAQLSEISPRQLNRLFRSKMEQSTMNFYCKLRLEKARELLKQSTLTITEIALANGFASSAHFAHSFRRTFGSTPSSLRQ